MNVLRRQRWMAFGAVFALIWQPTVRAETARNGGNWSFLDHYAVASIQAAHGVDEGALLQIERQANADRDEQARPYVYLARALRARLTFDLDGANTLARQCMDVASQVKNETALALCGWLRVNLATAHGDYLEASRMTGEIEPANRVLMQKAGLTEKEVITNPSLFSLRGPESYAGIKNHERYRILEKPTVQDKRALTYDDAREPLIEVVINGVHIKAMMDTGSGPTLVSSKLAKALNLEVTTRTELASDVQGRQVVARVAFAKALSIGSFRVSNARLFVADEEVSPPIVGMDTLRLLGRFAISHDALTLSPPVDVQCRTSAHLRSSIATDPALVGILVNTNFGPFYAGLDTGANDIGYALMGWDAREKFGFDASTSHAFHLQKVMTANGEGVAYYLPIDFSIRLGHATYRRQARMYSNFKMNFDITLGMDSTKDFTYYFDLPHGLACLKPVPPKNEEAQVGK